MKKDNIYTESIEMHAKHRGKISIKSKVPLESEKDLALAYTPGVSQPCLEIFTNKANVYKYTSKGNLVAVISDGSSVLGLGDIGPYAAIPVMEGKAILLKRFADIDAFPICINTNDPHEIIEIVKKISPVFGGILLEDISAPRCFEIEAKLKEELDIPIFHDDQHGTAVVVVAALINCLKIIKKKFEEVKIVINGAGAAGIAISKLLKAFNVGELIVCDTKGTIYKGRKENMSSYKEDLANTTNKEMIKGTLTDAMINANIFIGVSKPNVVSENMIKSMQKNPVILALSNPIPEIMPDEAKKAGAFIICTGRSDFSNQVNNVLVFPGIFRGALNAKAKGINEEMKISAAYALASLIPDNEIKEDYVIPKIFDPRVLKAVSSAVEITAVKSGLSKYS